MMRTCLTTLLLLALILGAALPAAAETGSGATYDPYAGLNATGGVGRTVTRDRTQPPVGNLVVFLGDSLTRGPGIQLSQTYPALIQEHLDKLGLPFRIVNAGVNGNTSANALARADKALEGPVAVLVVALGTNDANSVKGGERDRKSDEICRKLAGNLDAILAKARAKRVALVLVPIKLPAFYGTKMVSGFASVFQALAEKYRLHLPPGLLDGVWSDKKLWLANGHPNAAGHALMARNVWRVLGPTVKRLVPRRP